MRIQETKIMRMQIRNTVLKVMRWELDKSENVYRRYILK